MRLITNSALAISLFLATISAKNAVPSDCCQPGEYKFSGRPGQEVGCYCSQRESSSFEGVAIRGGFLCCEIGKETVVKQKLRLAMVGLIARQIRTLEERTNTDCGAAAFCFTSCMDATNNRTEDTEPAIAPSSPKYAENYVRGWQLGHKVGKAGNPNLCSCECLQASKRCSSTDLKSIVWIASFPYIYKAHRNIAIPFYERAWITINLYPQGKSFLYPLIRSNLFAKN